MLNCWQGTEGPASCTAHHFHFLVNDVRCGIWLVWHSDCSLVLCRVRSEQERAQVFKGASTQELVQVFEIYRFSKMLTLLGSSGVHTGQISVEHQENQLFWLPFARIIEKVSNICTDEECCSLQWGCTMFNSPLKLSEVGLRKRCHSFDQA